MKTKRKPQAIHVHGRRWFERTNGNTYHSVTVWVDGDQVHRTDFTYGYGDHWLQTATQALDGLGLLPGIKRYNSGGTESLWQYCQDRSIKLVTEVDDVRRKKDL